jgi:hypothetical protein
MDMASTPIDAFSTSAPSAPWQRWSQRVATVFALVGLGATTTLTGCTTETGDDEELVDDLGTDDADLSSFSSKNFIRIKTPAGMPAAWVQPASRGWFDEKGMCGPTSVANTLRLYGIEKSPTDIYEDGARSLIGTLPGAMEKYLDRHHADLKCSRGAAPGGEDFLIASVRAGRPVNVLLGPFNGAGAHWVTIVGMNLRGPEPEFILMTWGRYYKVASSKLMPYWFNHMQVSCERTSRTRFPQ